MQYTETQLLKLIGDVEKEFSAQLSKAEGSFPEKKKEEKEPEAKEAAPEKKESEGEHEKKPEGEAKEAPPAEEGADKAAAPAAEAPAAQEAAPAAEGSDACDYDPEDMAHMEKMYLSMSKGELKAHHDCIAKIAKCGDMSQAPMMQKSEENKTVAVADIQVTTAPSQEVELLKSEVATQLAKAESLQKSLDAVSAILTKLVEKKAAPAAKAITSLDVIAKSEATASEERTLTKSEVDSILTTKSMDSKLAKSDRDAINAYYLNGASINSISHLLK